MKFEKLNEQHFILYTHLPVIACVSPCIILHVCMCVSEWEHMGLTLYASGGQRSNLGVFFTFQLVWGRTFCFHYVFQDACGFSGKCLSQLSIPPWKTITEACMFICSCSYGFWGSKLMSHIYNKSSIMSPVHFLYFLIASIIMDIVDS